MAKTFATLALAFVGAVEAGNPMRNLNSGLCIQYGAYNTNNDAYAVKMGSCSDARVIRLRHVSNGKALVTDDSYCLSVTGTKVILEECLPTKTQWWSKVGVKQFRNTATNKCLEAKANGVVVSSCATLAADDNGNSEQWELKSLPAKPLTTCKSAGVTCPYGATYVNNYCGNPQHPKCGTARCCYSKPAPLKTCKTSGLVCEKYDAKPLKTTQYCGNPQHPACTIERCCIRNPRTCAKAGIRCPYGSVFVNNYCKGPGNPQHPPCEQKRCCRQVEPAPTTCSKWNKCPYGQVISAGYARCTTGTPSYDTPKCSASLCCAPKPVQTPTCQAWYDRGNRCRGGFVLVADASDVNGYSKDECCEQETCAMWLAREDDSTGDTNEETCYANGLGTIDPSLWDDVCTTKYGSPQSCSADLCCQA